MFLFAMACACLLALDNPASLTPEQFRDLIRTRSSPLQSMVFVYEGSVRWVGGPNIIEGPESFNDEFQGTFLFRGTRTALYDVYKTSPGRGGGVIRRKASLLNQRHEQTRDIVDAKRSNQPREVRTWTDDGTLAEFNDMETPLDLFSIWRLEHLLDRTYHKTTFEGWKPIDGHSCMVVRISQFQDAEDHNEQRDQSLFWVDLERNAQILQVENYVNGHLSRRIDEVRLTEGHLANGSSYWFPVHNRTQRFQIDDKFFREPLLENTVDIVAGSYKLNPNLPDSVFAVTRESAYPSASELAGVEQLVKTSSIVRKFQAQPPAVRQATDPISVRQRVEARLVEANQQAAELHAPSPAHITWTTTTFLQVGFGLAGVVMLGLVVAHQWRRR